MTTATHSLECEYAAQAQTAKYELTRFKDNVRDSFIEFVITNEIDHDIADEFLEGIGLEAMETEFPVVATYTYKVELNVKARTESEAYQLVDSNLFDMAPVHINISDTDKIEVTSSCWLDTYETI